MSFKSTSNRLIIEFSVRIAAEERDPYFGQQLLTNQFETTLQSVGHFSLALIGDQFNATAAVIPEIIGQSLKSISCIPVWSQEAVPLELDHHTPTGGILILLHSGLQHILHKLNVLLTTANGHFFLQQLEQTLLENILKNEELLER